ncbi:head-tail connector protein [Phenylobacterium terrae]|uniref:Head-tail connector protein n=1 Tax=Phenylobacterium terrae TaxID=2665495 RepID=A0ABW4N6Y6_9CAUL
MFWTRLTRVTPPTETVVSLDEAKLHLRIGDSNSDDDELVESLIASATAMVEGPQGIGVALLEQTWRLSVDELDDEILIPFGPVQSVTSVTYRDEDGATQTLATSLYGVDTDRQPAAIYRKPNQSYPEVEGTSGCVKVTFVTGAASAAEVPADLRHAVLLLVGHYYENREATSATSLKDIPLGVCALLDRHRVSSLA